MPLSKEREAHFRRKVDNTIYLYSADNILELLAEIDGLRAEMAVALTEQEHRLGTQLEIALRLNETRERCAKICEAITRQHLPYFTQVPEVEQKEWLSEKCAKAIRGG